MPKLVVKSQHQNETGLCALIVLIDLGLLVKGKSMCLET